MSSFEINLIEKAKSAMQNSYAPYSNYNVGAALLTKSGKLYLGCNVENSSFSVSICAERTAFLKAISDGEREFEAIAIVGGAYGEVLKYASPCGSCRQMMSEFCDNDFKIILGKDADSFVEFTLGELLPHSFSL